MNRSTRSSKLITQAGPRLTEEPVIWMTTVNPQGQPQTSPVWFIIEEDELLVYSLESSRVRNIASNPRVALNLDGNGRGGAIVTLEGTARLVSGHPPCWEVDDYLAKYHTMITELNHTPESFGAEYNQAVRIELTSARVW